MNKNTPLSRGVRTFVASMAGVLAASVAADWTLNSRASAIALALGTIAALIAGVIAFLTAAGNASPSTPLGKALATAAQYAAAGLATVAVADFTQVAFEDFGKAVLKVAIAAVFAGLTTLATNASEDAAA